MDRLGGGSWDRSLAVTDARSVAPGRLTGRAFGRSLGSGVYASRFIGGRAAFFNFAEVGLFSLRFCGVFGVIQGALLGGSFDPQTSLVPVRG